MSIEYDNVKAWYIVQTVQKMEDQCKTNIEQRIKSLNMQDYIFQVFIPKVKTVYKTKKGIEKTKDELIYPGYIFIEMIVTEDSWFIVRNTPLVTGFLGSSGGGTQPVPLTDSEIIPILKQGGIKIEYNIDFKVGDTVEIVSGNYVGQSGIVESIDLEKQTAKVVVEFLGRSTSTDFAFNEIKANK